MRQGRYSAYFVLARLTAAAIGMIALFAFTRVLSPTDYGCYSVILASAALISGVGFQWVRQCLVKFGVDPTFDLGQLLGSIGVIYAVLFVSMAGFAAVLAALISRAAGPFTPAVLAVTVALAGAQAWFELGLDACRVDLNPLRYGVAGLLRSALSLASGLLALWLVHSVIALVLGVALGFLAAGLLTAPRWLRGVAQLRKASWAHAKLLAGYGLPLALTLGFTLVIDNADRLMLAAMRGAAEAGVYASAYGLGQYAIGSLLSGLGLAVFPLAAKCYAEHGADETGVILGRNLLMIAGLALPATIGLVLLAPTLSRLLLGNFVSGESALITAIAAVGVAFAGVRSYAFDVVFMVAGKTKNQATLLGATAGLNILLNLIFIPRWGAVGAASAGLVSFILALGSSVLLGRRHIIARVRGPDLLKIVLAAAAMSAILVLSRGQSSWRSLILRVTVAAVVYACAIFGLNPLEIRTQFRSVFHSAPT